MNQIPFRYGVAAGLGIGLVWLSWNFPAFAHEAASGWSYPTACCSGTDCREVGDSRSKATIRIIEDPKGYRISTTGELIALGDRRLKNSPDGEFHWCSHGGRDTSGTICLFVPPRSF